jgi:hypothetical protein
MKSQMEGGEVAQQPLTLVLIGLLVEHCRLCIESKVANSRG